MSGKTVTTARATHGVVRVGWRWFTGHALDGEHRTDATLLRKGGKVVHPSGRAATWHYMPRWHRAKWRTIGTVALGYLLWGYVTGDPQAMAVLWLLLSFTGLVMLRELWRLWTEGKERAVEERVAKAMASRFGSATGGMAHDWVRYVPARRGRPTTTTVKLPGDYTRSLKQAEKDAEMVARKCGFKDGHDFDLLEDVEPPRLVVREMEVPPDAVLFEDAKSFLEKAGDGRYFLGLGKRRTEVWIDLNQQAPHLAWSCGTGAGKTVAARNLAAQIRREGGRIEIFDFAKEGESHGDWVYDEHGELFPGIGFYTEAAAAHEALVRLGEERSERSRLAREARQFRRPEPVFQRVLVIIEEMNTGTPELIAYWKRLRQEIKRETGIEQPLESPAITAYRDLVCKGRSTLMNVLAVAQRFDAKVTAGGDIRSNFAVRMLARFDDKARELLISEVKPKPVSSSKRGRILVCMDGLADYMQGVYLDIEQTREWAFGSPDEASYDYVRPVRAVEDASLVQASEQAEQADEAGLATVSVLPVRSVGSRPMGPVSLREAVDQRVVRCTKKAMENARDRKDPGFPTPVEVDGQTHRYARADLKAWEAGKYGTRLPVDFDADGGA